MCNLAYVTDRVCISAEAKVQFSGLLGVRVSGKHLH